MREVYMVASVAATMRNRPDQPASASGGGVGASLGMSITASTKAA